MSSDVVSGQVASTVDSTHTFQGNETLEILAVDASRMGAASITLGEQKISLKSGQKFPIPFEFSYDKSRGTGSNRLSIQAKIHDQNGHMIYINDTRTPIAENVTINVIKV